MKRILLILSLLLLLPILLLPIVAASNSGTIALMTVAEADNNTEIGGVANLQLVVKPGSGRIFIDSFPLSKIDTQITFRFAAEVACNLLEKDCSGYDFFYTVTANTGIVGGPSAGAAATVLTVAILDNQELDNTTIMTGTINSGNLIGPVAGINAKVLAAQNKNFSKVLIPEWDMANSTLNKNMSIEIVPISTLEEALYHFTGKDYLRPGLDAEIYSLEYSTMMKNITVGICSRYGSIIDNKVILPNLTTYGINSSNSSQDTFNMALDAINNGSFYSAASLCFSGNVRIQNVILKNLSDSELKIVYAKTLTDTNNFIKSFEAESNDLSTISELETYMIVSERMYDVKNTLSDMNPENISVQQLAYAIERLYTARAWSTFSSFPGPKFVMDQSIMMVACTKKLSEAEERLNYLELYYPGNGIREEMDEAYGYYSTKKYALCVFTASKLKADVDIILSAIFVPQEELDKLFDEKMLAARRVMNSQKEEGIFPILGYSYYEYARTLDSSDKYSALLYAEYALELSNIDMYFKRYEPLSITSGISHGLSNFRTLSFVLGVIVGILLTVLFFITRSKSRNKKLRKSRK